jgi:long-subunit acyl-CoA synthetase (AMP-forming)
VVLSVRCISSVSPRFCFRRHTFCFLPLAAILESFWLLFLLYIFYNVVLSVSLNFCQNYSFDFKSFCRLLLAFNQLCFVCFFCFLILHRYLGIK